MGNRIVPTSIAWVEHRSWGNNKISKYKVIYHNSRWASDKTDLLNGVGCSYVWDVIEKKIKFNKMWYIKHNLLIPETLFDTDFS